ncbi:MAG: hypothetical protein JO180_09535, partial [Gemmatirosa sp.]|nr:hypothetical protein [Gemmatirosa sp.]
LTLRDLDGRFTGHTGGGGIRITRTSGRASLTTGGGDVYVADADLSGSVRTGGGEVSVERNRGHLDMGGAAGRGESRGVGDSEARDETMLAVFSGDDGARLRRVRAGGAIELSEAPDGALLSTGGGGVHVGRARGLVSATTGGGDVTLGPVDGSAAARTGAGDVSITIAGDGGAQHDVDVVSGNGAVDLYLPADLSARLELETAYTNNLGRRTRIDSDWRVPITETDRWDGTNGTPRRYVRSTTTLGSGRSLVRVRTVNGDIRIHRR